ncbi:MAG: tripartite tricarboxylate transporter permease [Gammaproteobacteria bacterium]|nr:tripartite tricarboxylate transporter permease [Gammaproteobacteria bacterium]
MFEPLITAIMFLFSDGLNFFYLILGVSVGILFGIIPGLGGVTAIALLLPLTFGMSPEQALILMGGVMGAVSAGGAVTAILLNTPGTAPNAATCFDGYPLTQQGKAGLAIGAAASASAIGGTFGLFILVLVLPIAKTIVLWFGPPAFFMLALLGLTSLTVSSGNMLRGLIAGCLGLFVGFVGYDEIGGTARYTGGSDYLWNGLSIVPVLIGLFAIAEMISLFVKGGTITTQGSQSSIRFSDTIQGVKATLKNYKIVMCGSGIGALIGAIPGVGGVVASFMSYSFASQITKDNENFGKGDIRGVIASESANNAKDGGGLIPTLAFGVPGSAEMAVFLGVLILHGLNPGPLLLIEREYTIFVLILTLLGATILSAVFICIAAFYLVRIAYIDSSILIPSVISVSLVGAYAVNNTLGDVFTAAFFGLLGYLMIRFDYPRITLIIALVLCSLMERNYTQSMIMFQGDWTGFFRDNTAVVLLLCSVVALSIPAFQSIRKKKGYG